MAIDEPIGLGYNGHNIDSQAVKGRVILRMPFREPRLVERGTDRQAEHGPGAAWARGSPRRVRP